MPYSKKELKQLALDYIASVDDSYNDEVYCTPQELAKDQLEIFFARVFGFDLNSEQDPDVIVAKQGAEFTASIRGVTQRFKFVESAEGFTLLVLNLDETEIDLDSHYRHDVSYNIDDLITAWQ